MFVVAPGPHGVEDSFSTEIAQKDLYIHRTCQYTIDFTGGSALAAIVGGLTLLRDPLVDRLVRPATLAAPGLSSSYSRWAGT